MLHVPLITLTIARVCVFCYGTNDTDITQGRYRPLCCIPHTQIQSRVPKLEPSGMLRSSRPVIDSKVSSRHLAMICPARLRHYDPSKRDNILEDWTLQHRRSVNLKTCHVSARQNLTLNLRPKKNCGIFDLSNYIC